MTGGPVDLDAHRGMAAQRATELRRQLGEVSAAREKLKHRQDELEKNLAAAPAAGWEEAAAKARYLLSLFAASPEAMDPRRQTLIANVLDDFERLSGVSPEDIAAAEAPRDGNGES